MAHVYKKVGIKSLCTGMFDTTFAPKCFISERLYFFICNTDGSRSRYWHSYHSAILYHIIILKGQHSRYWSSRHNAMMFVWLLVLRFFLILTVTLLVIILHLSPYLAQQVDKSSNHCCWNNCAKYCKQQDAAQILEKVTLQGKTCEACATAVPLKLL